MTLEILKNKCKTIHLPFNQTKREAIYTGAAFLILTFMMLFNLTHSALWGDEWVEYHISQRSLSTGDMYSAIITTFQPPLYNFLMHFWLKLGSSILWFRLFNIILGELSAIFLFLTIKKITTPFISSLSVSILAISYQWVYCIQECSEYALMVMFLFGSFYYFIKCKYNISSLPDELLLIFMCIGAMYSQYGAFFVVVPTLILHFINKLFAKNKSCIIRTIKLYFIAFIFFAIPLYYFFARIQLQTNQITNNTNVEISPLLIKDIFLVFGNLIKYFFNITDFFPSLFFKLFGLLVLAECFIAIYLREKIIHDLAIISLTAYIIYVLLVAFNIYAMVHPGQSYGYYSRYAYFFIPVMSVLIPVMTYKTFQYISVFIIRFFLIAASTCLVLSCMGNLSDTLNNWNKSYDDEFFDIWYYNAGFNDDTYLFGVADFGFNYYTDIKNCNIQGNVHLNDVNYNSLPDTFWAWRTNWGGDDWAELIDYASNHGYSVKIYADINADYENKEQLAKCEKTETLE